MASDERFVLVTGGAGYIGSHTCKALHERGLTPVVYDDLSAGHREALHWGEFAEGDILDTAAVLTTLRQYGIKEIIHFAGVIEVARSVTDPAVFWTQNVAGLASVLEATRAANARRLVFSSSAAVYGQDPNAHPAPLREDAAKAPSSPYGDTKLAGERMISAWCRAYGLTGVALRYFNAAGADESGLIGEAHEPETHLIPRAVMAALGGEPVTVNGVDFPTPDGSCVRDYIHVNDLARAHVAALEAPLSAGAFEAVNVGAGRGYSVLEVLAAIEAAIARPLDRRVGPRREGDPAMLVADPARARALLGWVARDSDLQRIVADALRWHSAPKFGPQARTPTAHPKTAVV